MVVGQGTWLHERRFISTFSFRINVLLSVVSWSILAYLLNQLLMPGEGIVFVASWLIVCSSEVVADEVFNPNPRVEDRLDKWLPWACSNSLYEERSVVGVSA